MKASIDNSIILYHNRRVLCSFFFFINDILRSAIQAMQIKKYDQRIENCFTFEIVLKTILYGKFYK